MGAVEEVLVLPDNIVMQVGVIRSRSPHVDDS